eukprot:s4108_g3.t1
MLDVLEAMKLQLSYNKSFLIFAVAGSNHRKAIKGHLAQGAAGYTLLLPRCDGRKTALPVKSTGKYLGVLMSYKTFEESTWQLRKKAGWSAFVRLKPWFQNRAIPRHSKIQLWQSCVFSILGYGIFSTNFTVKILQDFQSTYYNMMRMVIGDHSYCTRNTHQQAFQPFDIEQPLSHLLRASMTLWLRLCRPSSQLHSHDFLRRVDWSHLLDAMQLLRHVQDVTLEAPMNPDVQADHASQATYYCEECQELHQHYRLYHADWTAGSHAKSAQITKILASSSPCNLCGKHFKRGHACPVATQLAALQLHAFPEVSAQADELKCDVCHMRFEDKGSLHVHLHSAHSLQVHLWNPARDALPHSDACAHCGALFSTRDGVRRHILDGRCASFNPDAPSVLQTALPRWEPVLCAGAFTRAGLAAMDRQHLTLVCQLCSTSYSRTADLLQHLQQSHSSLWTQSLPMLRYLLQTVVSREGCLCNPMSNDQGHTHICALIRQLSMLFASSSQELPIPQTFVSCQVLDHFPHVGAHDAMKVIALLLETRSFADLWQTPEILQFLCTHCLHCGGVFHPAALVQHCHSWHSNAVQWATQLAFQLVPILVQHQPQDHQCVFCGLIFNLPRAHDSDVDEAARAELLQIHFASNCPVLLQLLLLLQPLHDRADVQPGRTRPRVAGELARVGASDEPGSSIQKRRRRGASQQETQTGARRDRGASASQSSGPSRPEKSGSDLAAHHGSGDSSARTEPAVSLPTGILRYVHSSRSGGCSAIVGPACGGVEGTSNQSLRSSAVIDLENTSPPGVAAGAPEEIEANGDIQSRGTSLGPCNWSGPDVGRRQLAIPEMESGLPEVGDRPQSPIADAAGIEGVPIPHGAPCGLITCDPISFTAASGNNGSLAAPDESTTRRPLENDGIPGPVLGLELVGDIPQGTQPAAEPTSFPPSLLVGQGPPALEGPRQGEEADFSTEVSLTQLRIRLRQAAAQLTFDNDGTLCYANCAVISFIWACLSRSNFEPSNWGAQSDLFQSMLSMNDPSPVLLTQQSWFSSLIQHWPERGGQADGAEFTGRLMAWVASGCHSQQWQRRVMLGQRATIHDHGDQFMPLTVQLDPALCQDYGLRLDTLIRHWHGELGMTAALTGRPDLICVQIDRINQTPLGTLQKLCTPITFCGPVDVPVFLTEESIACEWVTYGMISAYAHYGDVTSGHYKALLQTAPVPWYEGEPVTWLHCDDHRPPEKCVDIPTGFQEWLTCVWLCRVDILELHQWTAHESRSQTGDSFLALFTAPAAVTRGGEV